MLTEQMTELIQHHRAGMVATVNDDGTPSVSPKGTFVILDNHAIAFGNIRSPGTLRNIRTRPAVEVCFIDPVLRKAVRATGTGTIHRKADADGRLTAAFEADWADYMSHISSFVVIDISGAEFIVSPAYDMGFTEQELRKTNLDKLNAL